MVAFSSRNTNIYKICKLCEAIFSMFYNISPPNFYSINCSNSTNFGMLFLTVVKDFVLAWIES